MSAWHRVVLRRHSLYKLIICSIVVPPLLYYLASILYPPLFDFRAHAEPTTTEFPSLRHMCTRNDWEPQRWGNHDVYINCYSIVMGAFNAINKLEVCIRWAIDSGVGLIRPQFVTRGNNISELWGDFPRTSLEFLLDEEHLWKMLAVNCPQMKVVELDELGTVNNVTGRFGREYFAPQYGMKRGGYGRYLKKHVKSNLTSPIPNAPIVVYERDSFGAWDRSSDPLHLQIEFHNLFHFSRPLVEAANKLSSQLPYSFFGLHLRLEADFIPTKIIGQDYINFILAHNSSAYPVAYAACGDVEKLREFKQIARNYGILVYDKWDLVTSEVERKWLEELEFDQLGILDFIVLKKSLYFLGLAGSSFSFSMGQHRHLIKYGNMNFLGMEDKQQLLLGITPHLKMFWDILW